MKKIRLLLHETTLLDFVFISNLLRRYWAVTFFIISFCICITAYIFYNQQSLYIQTAKFKIDDSIRKDVSLASVLDLKTIDNSIAVSINDINSIIKSWSFLESLAKKMLEHEDKELLNYKTFSDPLKQHIISYRELEKNTGCKVNSSCLVKNFSTKISSFLSIDKSKDVSGFLLRVSTYDEKTTSVVLNLAAKEIERARLQELDKNMTSKIDALSTMIEQKKSALNAAKSSILVSDATSAQKEFDELFIKINNLQKEIDEASESLKHLQIKLQVAQSNKKISITSTKRVAFERVQLLQQQILKYRENIQILNNSKDSDNIALVKELQKEIDAAQKEISRVGPDVIEVEALDKFSKNKKELIPQIKDEISFLEVSLQEKTKQKSLLEENLKMIQEKLSISENKAQHSAIGFDEYEQKLLEQMEQRRQAFVLQKATLRSDIYFTDFDPGVTTYRPYSEKLAIFFGLFIGLFISIITAAVRFILDDRIYSIREFSAIYPDVNIIGNTINLEK